MDSDKAMALLFFEQCCGHTDGHMSYIPNNPAVHVMMACCGIPAINGNNEEQRRKAFAKLLHGFAYRLEELPADTPTDPDEVPF